jgi:hypothetical protein
MGNSFRFERSRIGWIIAVLTFLSAVNSTFFFLGMMKSGIVGWLMMNSCAPSILIFFVGFLLKNPIVMTIGTVWMIRFGVAGLFVFGWSGSNLIAQVGHLLMTASSVYAVVETIRQRQWKALLIGVALGIVTLVPFMMIQNAWFAKHPGLLEQLFKGTYSPRNG